MSNFDTLLADLEQIKTEQETLAKSHSDGSDNGDAKIVAAADDKNKDKTGKPKEGEEGDELTKSLGTIKLEDGTEVAAIDGALLVKSLIERLDNTDTQVANVFNGLVGTIKAQGEMLKSMSDEIRALGGQGRGRKTVVTVTPKNEGTAVLAKSEAEGMTGEQFLLKSHAAFDAGKLNGRELNIIDVSLRMNQQVDPALVRKVMA